MKDLLKTISSLNQELQSLEVSGEEETDERNTENPNDEETDARNTENSNDEDLSNPDVQMNLLRRVEAIRNKFLHLKDKLATAETDEEAVQILEELKSLMSDSEAIEQKLKQFERSKYK